MKILAIVHTYGLQGVSESLRMLLKYWVTQAGNFDLDIVISDNRSKEIVRKYMREVCDLHPNVSLITTDKSYSIFITFNLAMKVFSGRKKYDYFIHACEDVFLEKANDLGNILATFRPEFGIVSAWTTKKFAPSHMRYLKGEVKKICPEPYVLGVGEVVCANFVVMNRKFMKAYNFKWPDFLAHANFDEQLWFLTAALGLRWAVCTTTRLLHQGYTSNEKLIYKPNGHKFGSDKKNDFFALAELVKKGSKYGYGSFNKHQKSPKRQIMDNEFFSVDRNLYNGDVLKNPTLLYNFLLQNLFVPQEMFDYGKIKFETYH